MLDTARDPSLREAISPAAELSQTVTNNRVARIAASVSAGACIWITLVAGSTLIGWFLHSAWLVRFPTPRAPGTLMVSTAATLLLSAVALWLLRREDLAVGRRRVLARVLASLAAAIGLFFLMAYAAGWRIGHEWLLFRGPSAPLRLMFPGQPSVASSLSLLAGSLALLWLDARSRILRRVSEGLALLLTLIGVERVISFFFGETGAYAPGWQLFGEPVLHPMSPKTASCFIALALGILYARPERGLVGMFVARGSGGRMARWLLSAAIILPVVFGWLGLVSIRAGLRGSQYPLSLVVITMIVLLILVVSVNSHDIQKVEAARTRAIAALAERERLLRAVFDNAGSGLALVDIQGRPITTNGTLQQMLGYDEAELNRTRFADFTHHDDRAADLQLFNELLAGERDSYRMEKRYLRKDGQVFWGQMSVSVARDTRNQPEFIVAMVEDVTERKKAEEAQRRLTEILEATPDFVGIADTQARAVYVNRAGREIAGVNDGDLSGLAIPDFHPMDSARQIVATGLPAALQDGVWHGETELLSRDGEHIPVSQVLLAHRGSAGEVTYYSTIMRDISDRKLLEETQQFLLEASNAFSGSLEIDDVLRSITRLTVPARADYCAIDLVTQEGEIERAVLTRVDRHGRPRGEHITRRAGQIHPLIAQVVSNANPLIIPDVTEQWLTELAATEKQRAYLRKLAPRSIMVVPLRGRDRVIGAICFCVTGSTHRYDKHDLALTEQMAARATLALENARLFQESRAATHVRDEVLRVVAHDLRNPLNTISLSAGLLNEQMKPQERAVYGDQLDIIGRSITRADRLIEDLLDVARMEAGRLTIEVAPLDARALLAEVVDAHQPLAEQRGISLRVELPQDSDVALSADRHRLLQVLENLLGNALKFTPEGGHVTVRLSAQDHTLLFSVQDDGPGIAESDMPHLFDPFWQAAHQQKGGAGLGLPIARGVVEAHGGRIWAESKTGQGSTFAFTLPLDRDEQRGHALAAD